eukprot:487784_1
MLRQINVIDIRDTIFIFTGNFLLNLLILKCHNDEDSKEWIKQKTIILDNLHEFYYTHILLSQPQKFADCFKPIVNLKYLKKHKKSKRDIFVVLNPNQTIHDKHKREIYNGYNTFTGSKKSNVFYLFMSWKKKIARTGKDMSLYKLKTELILKQIIPLVIRNMGILFWYFRIEVKSNGHSNVYATLHVVAQCDYDSFDK